MLDECDVSEIGGESCAELKAEFRLWLVAGNVLSHEERRRFRQADAQLRSEHVRHIRNCQLTPVNRNCDALAWGTNSTENESAARVGYSRSAFEHLLESLLEAQRLSADEEYFRTGNGIACRIRHDTVQRGASVEAHNQVRDLNRRHKWLRRHRLR